MEAAVALREQPEIRELFQILEGNGLKKERQEVETFINYLEGMESQFGQVMKELKEVRGQLEQCHLQGFLILYVGFSFLDTKLCNRDYKRRSCL